MNMLHALKNSYIKHQVRFGMISGNFEFEDFDGNYTGISQLRRKEKNKIVLQSDRTLVIVDGRHSLPAIQILGRMVTSETNSARDQITIALLVRIENETITLWEVINLSSSSNISSLKNKNEISIFDLMSIVKRYAVTF